MIKDSEFKKLVARVERMEKIPPREPQIVTKKTKEKTLPELVKGREFKNGQQKVAVIIAYREKYGRQTALTMQDVVQGWRDGKFDGSFARTLLDRAISDGLVRDLKDGTFDLSQSGDAFYEEFMK